MWFQTCKVSRRTCSSSSLTSPPLVVFLLLLLFSPTPKLACPQVTVRLSTFPLRTNSLSPLSSFLLLLLSFLLLLPPFSLLLLSFLPFLLLLSSLSFFLSFTLCSAESPGGISFLLSPLMHRSPDHHIILSPDRHHIVIHRHPTIHASRRPPPSR